MLYYIIAVVGGAVITTVTRVDAGFTGVKMTLSAWVALPHPTNIKISSKRFINLVPSVD